MTRPHPVLVHHALDAARFGAARTLDLRASRPTALQASARAERWLRERQASLGGDVLVITGRGAGSPDGVSVVREAVRRLLGVLKRKGVVGGVADHTPGSFVVTLAPMRALFDAAPRSRRPVRTAPPADPAELDGLPGELRARLRWLAERSLESLGAPRRERFVRSEMLRQFAALADGVERGAKDRENRLRALIDAACDAFDDTR